MKQVETALANHPGQHLVVTAVTASGVLLVRDLPAKVTEDMLRNYFENPRRGGAGEVTSVQIVHDQRYALVTLEDSEGFGFLWCLTPSQSPRIISGRWQEVPLDSCGA